MREQIKIELLDIIQEASLAPFSNESDRIVEDLNIDSLEYTSILMELEKKFDIAIDDEIAYNFETIKDLIDYVEEQLK